MDTSLKLLHLLLEVLLILQSGGSMERDALVDGRHLVVDLGDGIAGMVAQELVTGAKLF